MIELTVKTLDARNHEFSVEDGCTVAQLKQHISERIGLDPAVQRLIFRGRVLSDTGTLAELDVNGKVIHLVEREPPRPGQRPPASADGAQPTQPLPWGRGGVFPPQQVENVLLEAIGVRGFPTDGVLGLRAMAPEDNSPQVGPTMTRLALVRRMLDHININMTALDQMTAMLPTLSNEPSTSARGNPTIAQTIMSVLLNETPEADQSMEEPMVTDPPSVEEEAAHMSEEWADASNELQADGSIEVRPETPTSSEAGVQASAQTATASTTTETQTDSRDEGRNNNGPGAQGPESEERARRAGEQMSAAVRELVALQQSLCRHFASFADALQETHVAGSERLRVRQRMVRRMTDLMHNLSHLYHALSDVEVTLTPAHPRCLSAPPPRRVQIPIQTQINVMSNRRPGAAAAPGGTPAAPPAAQPAGAASVTVTSSGPMPSQREPGEGRQPTVHVDIRPEPLSYQVEIETRVPIAFAINNGAHGMAASARLNQGPPAANSLAAAAAAAAASAAAAAAASGPTGAAAPAPAAPATPSAPTANGPLPRAAGAAPAAQGPRQPGQPINPMVVEQGGDFIMGVSMPLNWDSLNQGQPHLIAGPFPFANGAHAADTIQSMLRSVLSQEAEAQQQQQQQQRTPGAAAAAAGGAAAAAAGGAARHVRTRRHLRVPRNNFANAPYRQSVFDRFLPCQYDPVHRSSANNRGDEATSSARSARQQLLRSASAALSDTDRSFTELIRAMQGLTISDFIPIEHYLPGESLLVDALTQISRVMNISQLVVAWRNQTGLAPLRAPLRQLIVTSVLRGTVPSDPSLALPLFLEASEALVEQNRGVLAWIESTLGAASSVDLERSLRAVARSRLPPLLLFLCEEPRAEDRFDARFVALASRAFVEACAVVQRAGHARGTTLQILFMSYVEEFLQHMEVPLLAQVNQMLAKQVIGLARACRAASVDHVLVSRAPPPAPPPAPPQPMDQDAQDARDLGRGAFSVGAMRSVRPRVGAAVFAGVGPSGSPQRAPAPPARPASAPPRAAPAPAIPASSPASGEVPPPPSMPSEWVAAVRRDLARQRVGAARAPYSDAYLSGAPPRKRKLLTQNKPRDLAEMMQECIREATQAAPAAGGGAGGGEVWRAEDAGVRRAYWEHIRGLARARLCGADEWSRERYPASYHYFAAAGKRPFPDDSTD